MQVSIRLAAFLSIAFAATCLWFAIEGFTSLANITDPDEVSGAKSFAWFWSFLAVVGAVIALLSWKVAQAQDEES
jgi:hypothetical protein